MKVRECQQCGATLPEAPDDLAITCQFCGTTYDPTTAFRPAVMKVKMDPGTGRKILWIVAASILLPISIFFATFVILGVATCGVMSSTKKAVDRTKAVAPAKQNTAIKPSELANNQVGGKILDCAPPPGGFGELEAVAAIPWAVSLAQAWRKDARLHRVDVDKLRRDGVVNARDDESASVLYRFLSPSMMEEGSRQADLGGGEVNSELFIWVKKGGVKATVVANRHSVHGNEMLPPHPASLPLKQILDGLDNAGKLPSKPFYNGFLNYLSYRDEGWVWYISTLAGGDDIPRTRAADGIPWPYENRKRVTRSQVSRDGNHLFFQAQ